MRHSLRMIPLKKLGRVPQALSPSVHSKPILMKGVVLAFHIYHALEEQLMCSATQLAELSMSMKTWLMESWLTMMRCSLLMTSLRG
eukprot:10581674-Karenia_brevis.AAC.1